jgi:hypothetical protein
MIRTSAARFFLVVTPAPMWMKAALAVALTMGIATVWLSPREVDAAFGSLLLLQMFSASNGYSSSAARGYFDPILVSGRSRTRIAVGNLVAASIPGVAAWLSIVTVAAGLGQLTTAAAPHRVMALLMVSCVSWAAGLALPRLAAGALWSLLLVALAMSRGVVAEYLVAAQSTPTGFRQVLISASASTACPFLLLGEFPGLTDPRVLALDAIVALAVAIAGIQFIRRREYALGERA